MATDLHTYGPFEIPHDTKGKGKRITGKHGKEFWADPTVDHLRLKQGCYVFAMRAAKGFRVWYVGQASEGFEQETFTDHKRNHFNDVLFESPRGTPVLFFVAPEGNRRKVPTAELNHMEKELTQYALKKNPDVRNVQNTKNTPKWTIQGVIRSDKGKPTAAASKFKKLMGM